MILLSTFYKTIKVHKSMAIGRKKLLCVLPSLKGGGAERVMLTLTEHFSRDAFEPVLVLFERTGDLAGSIPPGIRVIDLEKKGRLSFFRLILKLAGLIEREEPDAVLSFLWYADVISVMAGRKANVKIPVVISARNYMSSDIGNENWGLVKRNIIRYAYNRASRIITLANKMGDDLVRNFKINQALIAVIPNPIDIERIERLQGEKVSHPWLSGSIPVIVSAGRLNKQKDFPTLIRAFSLVRQKMEARLIIIGEGEERPNLERLVRELGMASCVDMPGFARNPYPYIKRADLYVMSSFYEGFPNALVEAMACGTPVVSTACPGPDEIITDGVTGYLVPVSDVDRMAQAIERVLGNKEVAGRLAEAAGRYVNQYHVSRVVSMYEKVISEEVKKYI